MNADDLRGIPLLSHLDDDTLSQLATRCTTRTHRRGEMLWRAGDAGDELLVLLTGELEVLGSDDEVLARVGPGECVGEMALLLDDRRSASVVCTVAASVIVITRDAFDEVVKDHRALALLTAVVSRRAVALTERRPLARRLLVVGVVADDGVPGASLVAATVAALAQTVLGREVVALDASRELLEEVAAKARIDAADADLAVIDVTAGVALDDVLEVCDRVVRVTADAGARGDGHIHVVVNRHATGAPAISINACDPFVLPDAPELASLSKDELVDRVLADQRGPLRPALERLTKKLFGVTVGIALGGGAAFGIAHVGVLQALADAGIVPDLYAGTSFGSIVALGAAGGLTGDEMAEIARTRGNVRTTMSVLDPAVDGSGLLAGRRLIKIFTPMLSGERFEDLQRPCRVVATDIESGERVDIGEGRLDIAFRASCSIPLIFSPVVVDGRTLVDGAMVDPVPAEVARAMGADIVIAVNVVPRLEKGLTNAISRTLKRLNWLNPLSFRTGSRGLPDIVDVLMNALQVVQHELGRFRSLAGDIEVDVDLAGFTWIEFYRASELVERGRVAGEATAPEVQALIASRLA